jgi:hypothetical protein
VVRQLFPNSVLLAEPGGTSHADSLSGDLCVDGTIAAYLESGKLPAAQAERQVGQDLRSSPPAGAHRGWHPESRSSTADV